MGPQKAAVFMLSLQEAQAGKILQMMDDEEIRSLSSYMATLGTVNASLVEELIKNFSEQLSTSGSLVGTFESTERLLTKVMNPERVQQIMEEIRGPSGRTMWDKLGNVNEAVLANYLKNEYPQTVAVILTKVKPSHAARVLALLPENFAMEVVMRMLRMETVQKDILAHVEKTLRTEFMTNLARSNRADSKGLMAEIFNSFDRSTENRFMAALEERTPDMAQQIKQLMFTFEDLQRLDPSGVQVLLRQVPKEQLMIALKGASEAMKEIFFSNMSERAAKMMRDDMAASGPVRLRDVDEAQSAIVATAKSLADANEIILSSGGDSSDELVY
ncbi:Flagellar motor switch protein FliG [Candidatus Defluviicoccus seviourii]|uniref:Flagellar motor switch protein FliG n=2 Tax=root TaxID=1 RepID=A0A564WBT5_9PROT|nr:Flagellar motor switch protein FliG [uncultured Defluviicoccus sp.]VUX44968.1 Flagellar motor switch protein FliG [Candidatus Defluviicoccus seviourii]